MSRVQWLGGVEWLGEPVVVETQGWAYTSAELACMNGCKDKYGSVSDYNATELAKCIAACGGPPVATADPLSKYKDFLVAWSKLISKYKGYLVAWSKAYNGPALTPPYGDYAGDKSGIWDCFRDGQTLSAFAEWWGVNHVVNVGSKPTSGVCQNVLVAELTAEHRAALDKFVVAAFAPKVTKPSGEVTVAPGGGAGEKPPPKEGANLEQEKPKADALAPSTTTTKKTPWGLILLGGAALVGLGYVLLKGAGELGGAMASNPRGSGEVVPSRRWKHRNGATASPYGAVPWTGAPGNRKEDWSKETVGWTIQWGDGTVGIGRQPFKTQAEAQAWLNKENARLAEARARLSSRASNPRKRALSPPYSRSVSSKYGAPMGRRADSPSDFEGSVTVKQVPLEGDYDPGGAYWGGGSGTQPLFVAYDADGHERYTRASSLAAAKTKFSNEGLQVEAKSDVNLDVFFNAYVEAALWSSTDESDESGGEPLDKNYGPEDITKDALKKMRRDADSFAKAHAALIVGEEGQAGHDFWLTRNGHGAGFWDGDWPEPAATILTDASKKYGEQYLEVYRKKITVM